MLTLDGDQARAEPHPLRYDLFHFHTTARIPRSGRRLKIHLQHDWPWVETLYAAFQRLAALPMPAT